MFDRIIRNPDIESNLKHDLHDDDITRIRKGRWSVFLLNLLTKCGFEVSGGKIEKLGHQF